MEAFFSAVFYFFSASFSADTQRDALSLPVLTIRPERRHFVNKLLILFNF
jgi:hypothetical protein